MLNVYRRNKIVTIVNVLKKLSIASPFILTTALVMESGLTTKLRQFSSNVLTLEKSDGFF